MIRCLALWVVIVLAGCSTRPDENAAATIPVTWNVEIERDTALSLLATLRDADRQEGTATTPAAGEIAGTVVAVIIVVVVVGALLVLSRGGGGGSGLSLGGGGDSSRSIPETASAALLLRRDDRTVRTAQLAWGGNAGTWMVAPGRYRWALRLNADVATEIDLGALVIDHPHQLDVRCANGVRTVRVRAGDD